MRLTVSARERKRRGEPGRRWTSTAGHSPGRLVDRASAFGPILEGAEIVDLGVTHVLEYLAAQGRAPARGAIDDDGFLLGEILVVVGRLGIGAEFQHAARDV